MEDIDFLVDFVAGNSNKLQKSSLEGKISWALNVLTPGPTAQATLVAFKSCDSSMELWFERRSINDPPCEARLLEKTQRN